MSDPSGALGRARGRSGVLGRVLRAAALAPLPPVIAVGGGRPDFPLGRVRAPKRNSSYNGISYNGDFLLARSRIAGVCMNPVDIPHSGTFRDWRVSPGTPAPVIHLFHLHDRFTCITCTTCSPAQKGASETPEEITMNRPARILDRHRVQGVSHHQPLPPVIALHVRALHLASAKADQR